MSSTVLLVWVASMVAAVSIAAKKDFNRWLAFGLAFLLGPIGVAVVALERPGVNARDRFRPKP